MRHRAVYILKFGCVSQYYSMPIRWHHKMYWKESLIIKGSAIYQLASCPCIFLHYQIELFHTSNIIRYLFVSVIIRVDRNV